MPMHWVPWLVGGFLMTPFLIWAGLSAFVFPGAWNGFNAVIGTSALGATLPLAAWFFLRGIGGFANAMAGDDPDGELRHWLPRMILRILPLSAVVLGVIGAFAVLGSGQPMWTAATPVAVGLVVAFGILGGEKGVSRGLINLPASVRARVTTLLQRSALFREIQRNEHGGRDWFLMNLVLLGVLAMLVNGAPTPVLTVGLILVPVGFVTLYLAHQHRGGRTRA